ncbi:hypothetical protein F4860DRAFT_494764 [Xylaria cubensis]|nr:hypothetical protein F4860DRAFT_494764 [Xylaria cubensis]
MPAVHPTLNTDAEASHSNFDFGVRYPLSGMIITDWDSAATEVLAGVFFGISAALLVIALPLVLCNYCRVRRLSAREGRLQI